MPVSSEQIKELFKDYILKSEDVTIRMSSSFYTTLVEMLKEDPSEIINSSEKIQNILEDELTKCDLSITMPKKFDTELLNLIKENATMEEAWRVSSAQLEDPTAVKYTTRPTGGFKRLKPTHKKIKKNRTIKYKSSI